MPKESCWERVRVRKRSCCSSPVLHLIDRDCCSVAQNVDRHVGSSGQVRRDDERRFRDAPKGELSLLFIHGRAGVADHKQVGVCPVVWSTCSVVVVVLHDVAHHLTEVVADIAWQVVRCRSVASAEFCTVISSLPVVRQLFAWVAV